LHFAPVRAGKARSAPPPTGRLTTSGCFWGTSSLRARASGRVAHDSWSWLGSARLFWTCSAQFSPLAGFPHTKSVVASRQTNVQICLVSKRLRLSLPSLQHPYHKARGGAITAQLLEPFRGCVLLEEPWLLCSQGECRPPSIPPFPEKFSPTYARAGVRARGRNANLWAPHGSVHAVQV